MTDLPKNDADAPPPPAAAPVAAARPARRGRPGWSLAAPAASALLLLAATAWGLTLPTPGDADPFHASIQRLALGAPLRVAGYRGRDETVATEAVELLRPNVIVSRTFVPDPDAAGPTVGDSPWVQFLLVQCRDARDILGHWPPVCYVANGYAAGPVEDASWRLDGRELPGRRYHFSKDAAQGLRSGIVVANFLVLPDGRIVRGMDEVTAAGGDYRLRYFGAAQVQVLTPQTLPDADRRRVEDAFVEAHRDLIQEMASGVGAEPRPG